MSTYVQRAHTCVSCGDTQERAIADGVNISRSPRPRELLLARTFQRYTCTCGARLVVDDPFTYVDFQRKQLYLQYPRAWRSRWRELEPHAATVLQHNLTDPALPPFVHDLADGIALRVVFGLEALREKIMCAEAGLDDVVLEASKLELLRAGLQLATDDELRLDTVDDDLQLFTSEGDVTLARADYERMTTASYAPLRTELSRGAFVDLARIVPLA